MNEANFQVKVYSAVGFRQVNAINISAVKETYTRKDGQQFEMEKTLDGRITFICEDYEYFKKLAESDRRYDTVIAEVSELCGGVWLLKWSAYINVLKGTFNHSSKTYTCSLVLNNNVGVLNNAKNKEVNLYSIVGQRKSTTSQYATNTFAGVVFANGLPLYDCVFGLLRESTRISRLTSDFFKWNPTNPNYTLGINQKLQNQAIYHKSDIQRASTPGLKNATILNMSLDTMLTNLCKLYNMRYMMDNAGNFRIEHVSWFTHTPSAFLQAPKFAQFLQAAKEFTYDEPKIYRYEKFTNEGSVHKDFVGLPIEYGETFLRGLEVSTADTIERHVTFITDVDAISKDAITNKVSDDDQEGAVLLALTNSNDIEQVAAVLPNVVPQKNNVNSWATLHQNFWKHDRIFSEGLLNGQLTSFTTTQRIKKRKTIIIPFCCDDVIEPNALFLTDYGNAIANKVAIDRKGNKAEIELLYYDVGTTYLYAPVANDDVYSVIQNTILDTSAAGKPSVIANDNTNGFGTVQAIQETKPTLVGGTVAMAANGHFVYTPPNNFTGIDTFDYKIVASGSVVNNGKMDFGQVKIIVKSGAVYVRFLVYQYPTPANYRATLYINATPYWLYHFQVDVKFYEDPNMQVPLDLTGYGITLQFSTTKNGNTTNSSVTATGFSMTLYDDYSPNATEPTNSYPQSGTAAPTFSATLTPSSQFTII